jgi:hypothetical protein
MAKTKNDSIVRWDEELAKEAMAAAAMEANTGGVKFISVRGGVLTWNDAPVPGNAMAVVILDHVMENVYYTSEFDPDNPSSPDCFAFGRDEATMEPHKVAKEAGTAQEGPCKGCPQNEWGSADKGRGKACRNVRRLGLISAGQLGPTGKLKLIDETDYYAKDGELAFFKVPVTSVKGFAGFVKQVASALKRPPHGIVTKLSVQPDPKSQFKVVFEPIMELPNSLMSSIMKRREEVKGLIEQAYAPRNEDEAPKQKGKAKGRQVKGAKGAQPRY